MLKHFFVSSFLRLLVSQKTHEIMITVEFREEEFSFSQSITCILTHIADIHLTLPFGLGFSQSNRGRAKHWRGKIDNGIKHPL